MDDSYYIDREDPEKFIEKLFDNPGSDNRIPIRHEGVELLCAEVRAEEAELVAARATLGKLGYAYVNGEWQKRTENLDDDHPVTKTWLQSVGFKFPYDGCGWQRITNNPGDDISIRFYENAPPDVYLNNQPIKAPVTRGCIRLLCRALGIALKESR